MAFDHIEKNVEHTEKLLRSFGTEYTPVRNNSIDAKNEVSTLLENQSGIGRVRERAWKCTFMCTFNYCVRQKLSNTLRWNSPLSIVQFGYKVDMPEM